MRRLLLLVVVLLAVAVGSAVAFAASLGVTAKALTSYGAASTVPTSTCTATASQDSYVDSQRQRRNYGSSSTLSVGSRTFRRRTTTDIALVQVDPSCVPANAKIVSAHLVLQGSQQPGHVYGAYRITSSWSQGSVNWRNRPSIGSESSVSTSMDWNVTSDVQSIVDGGAYYGWAIEDDSSGSGLATYDSIESGSPPTLTITYWP